MAARFSFLGWSPFDETGPSTQTIYPQNGSSLLLEKENDAGKTEAERHKEFSVLYNHTC